MSCFLQLLACNFFCPFHPSPSHHLGRCVCIRTVVCVREVEVAFLLSLLLLLFRFCAACEEAEEKLQMDGGGELFCRGMLTSHSRTRAPCFFFFVALQLSDEEQRKGGIGS